MNTAMIFEQAVETFLLRDPTQSQEYYAGMYPGQMTQVRALLYAVCVAIRDSKTWDVGIDITKEVRSEADRHSQEVIEEEEDNLSSSVACLKFLETLMKPRKPA